MLLLVLLLRDHSECSLLEGAGSSVGWSLVVLGRGLFVACIELLILHLLSLGIVLTGLFRMLSSLLYFPLSFDLLLLSHSLLRCKMLEFIFQFTSSWSKTLRDRLLRGGLKDRSVLYVDAFGSSDRHPSAFHKL
jgi:hypothetical protein